MSTTLYEKGETKSLFGGTTWRPVELTPIANSCGAEGKVVVSQKGGHGHGEGVMVMVIMAVKSARDPSLRWSLRCVTTPRQA